MRGDTPREGSSRRTSARRAARLAAVQALYQIDQTGYEEDATRRVIGEFRGRPIEEIGGENGPADEALFADLVAGVVARRGEIDEAIAASMSAGSNPDRIQILLRAILRAGAYELLARDDVPVPVVINEYMEVSHAFFDARESAYVNGVLDNLARRTRAGAESPRPRAARSE